jgi:spermidine/putrescine transport system permease protein
MIQIKRKNRITALIALLPMYLFTVIFIIGPLVYLLVLSFERRTGAWGVEAVFNIDSYKDIFSSLYLKTFVESIKLALVCTVLVALVGYPFGYFMSLLSPRGKNIAMLLLIIPFWTSTLMRLNGWIIFFRANGVLDDVLISLGLTAEPLKLLYSYPAVVVGMIYVLLPFMIYSVYASAEKLDRRLIEAAYDLGASKPRVFATVILPLTMPGLFSGVVLTFVPTMGLYYVADVLGGNKVVLIGNVIQEQLVKVHNWPFAAALSVVLLILTTVFLLAYRKLTKGGEIEGLI